MSESQPDAMDVLDEFWEDDEDGRCWQCGGEGWGIVGLDWAALDPGWGPQDGEVQQCPCCGGSGLAKDCTYW